MHDVVWQGDVNCVRSKGAQKQLARTSLNNLTLLLAVRPHEPRPPTQKLETIIFMDIEFSNTSGSSEYELIRENMQQ